MVSPKTRELITSRTEDWTIGSNDRLAMYRDTLESVFLSLGVDPSQLNNVADIATGYGASTQALGEKAVNAHIYGCSIGDEPSEEVASALGNRFTFEEQEFSDFLESPKLPTLDLVLMAAAPYNGLSENGGKGYIKLGEKINRNGYFLAMTDTPQGIDSERMREAGFTKIRFEDKSVFPCVIWRKS